MNIQSRPMDTLPPLITQHLDEVRALCEKYRVKRLTLFGSAVKGTFDESTSDVDLLVEFFPEPDPLEAGRSHLKFWNELEALFGRKVDLIGHGSIENPYVAASVRRHQVDLYEAA
jgi:uncharacterized protein